MLSFSTIKTSRAVSSDALAVTVCLVALLVSFANSYTVQRHDCRYYLLRTGARNWNSNSNSVCASPWDSRRANNKSNSCLIGSTTRMQLSYQPPTSQDDKTEEDRKDAEVDDDDDDDDETNDRSFYEILDASPDATRNELKKQYITLAKVSHPDAQIGSKNNNSNAKDAAEVDFQNIAEAWRTLGNPKSRRRYDRQLKAKAWGEAAQRLTNERLEQVAPVASKFVDLAVPFLRKTSATTQFVGKAIKTGLQAAERGGKSSAPVSMSDAAETERTTQSFETEPETSNDDERVANSTATAATENDIQSDKDVATSRTTTNLNAAVETQAEPIEATRNQTNGATTATNSIPYQNNALISNATISMIDEADTDSDTPDEKLNEKSLEIEEQVKTEEAKAKTIHEELDSVKEQRLFATLQSPNYTLTSIEAEEVLEKINAEETVSFVNRATMKTQIKKEIVSLRNTEEQFTEKLASYTEIDREWNQWLTKQEVAKKALNENKKKESEARQALNTAEEMVTKANTDVIAVSNKLRGVEQEVRKSAQEMDRVSTTLSKKQEKVQSALKRKTELMKGGVVVQYITAEEVKVLRSKETQLMGESQQIATMVAKLQSRADQLKKRAEALERLKKN